MEQESPFLRGQKRVSVRRGSLPKKTATRLTWAAVALASCSFAESAWPLFYHYGERSWRFRVESSDDIEISGLQNVTRAQVMEVMGGDIGRNIFFVPLAQRKTQLEQIPWVESASVMRFVPNRLKVEIHERTPVAFARVGSRILLDRRRRHADGIAGQEKIFLPGDRGHESAASRFPRALARMKIYNDVVSQLDSGGAHYSQELSEVDLSDPDDVKVTGQQSRGRSAGPSGLFQLPGALQDLRHPRAGMAAAVRQTGIGGLALRPADHRQSGFAGSDEAAAALRRSRQEGHGGGGEAGSADYAHQLVSQAIAGLDGKTSCDIRGETGSSTAGDQRKDRPTPRIAKHAVRPARTWSKARAKAKARCGAKTAGSRSQARAEVRSRGKGGGETKPGNCQGTGTQ